MLFFTVCRSASCHPDGDQINNGRRKKGNKHPNRHTEERQNGKCGHADRKSDDFESACHTKTGCIFVAISLKCGAGFGILPQKLLECASET